MGHVISAACECGYHEDNLVVGAGRQDFGTVLMQPARCQKCAHVRSVNAQSGNFECVEHSDQKLSLYSTDKNLQLVSGENIVSQWQDYEINDGFYLCPNCKSFRLTFSGPHAYFDGSVDDFQAHLFGSRVVSAATDLDLKDSKGDSDDFFSEHEEEDVKKWWISPVQSLEEIESLRAMGEVESVLDLLENDFQDTSMALIQAAVRGAKFPTHKIEHALLITAEQAACEGKVKHAGQFRYAYQSLRNARIVSEISRALSENKGEIEAAIANGGITYMEAGFRVLLAVAPLEIKYESFDPEELASDISFIRTMSEHERLESENLNVLAAREQHIAILMWWLVAWNALHSGRPR